MATPAQEAREYAAQYGFTISKAGDKYEVTGNGLTARLSGYPAVLNAMRRHIDSIARVWSVGTTKDTDGSQRLTFTVAIPADAEVLANTSPRADYTVSIKTNAEVLDDLRAGIAWVHQSDPTPRPGHVTRRVPEPKHWRISYTSRINEGRRLVLGPYVTRGDALRNVRRLFSDPSYRNRDMRIEYVS